MCPVNLMSIWIIINIPPIAYLCSTWSFGKRLGKRFWCFAPRTVWRCCECHLDVTHRTGIVFHYHDVIILSTLHQRCVYVAKIGVIEQFRFAKFLEIFRRSVIQTMIILVVFLVIGKLARNARSPDNHELPFHIVVKQFRSPYIYGWCIFHYFNETLLCPMYQVLRWCIPKPSITSPWTCPY